jgi:hypothetical protein
VGDVTPVYGWPFELLGDRPDGATLGESLALAIEDDVARIDASLAAVVAESAGTAPLITAWTAWSTTWTGATTNPVIGNGRINGRYKLVGQICFLDAIITVGSTTAFGSGIYSFSFPAGITAKTDVDGQSSIVFGLRDNSAATHAVGFGTWGSGSSTMDCRVQGGNQLSPTVPFTFAQNDFIRFWGFVEKL